MAAVAAGGCSEETAGPGTVTGGATATSGLNTGGVNSGATAGTTGTTSGATAGTTGTTSGVTAGTAGTMSGVTAGTTTTAGTTGATTTGGTADGGTDEGGATTGGDSGGTGGGANCLMGTGDYSDDGPYAVSQEDVTIGSSGPYTLFYPSDLDDGCPHPVVAWGNGTSVTGSRTYAFYQEHAASWGIVVVASHNANTGSGDFHVAGLDYMYEQNEDSSSKFYGKLSDKAGTSGHSQGGGGANAGARHPNVVAIGNVQGAFGSAPSDKAFLCLTGTEDIAIEGCKRAVNGTSSPALYANWQGGTHTGTATLGGWIGGDEGSKQYRRFYTAWFRCFLADDKNACELFMGGDSCPVCQESGWAEIFANNY